MKKCTWVLVLLSVFVFNIICQTDSKGFEFLGVKYNYDSKGKLASSQIKEIAKALEGVYQRNDFNKESLDVLVFFTTEFSSACTGISYDSLIEMSVKVIMNAYLQQIKDYPYIRKTELNNAFQGYEEKRISAGFKSILGGVGLSTDYVYYYKPYNHMATTNSNFEESWKRTNDLVDEAIQQDFGRFGDFLQSSIKKPDLLDKVIGQLIVKFANQLIGVNKQYAMDYILGLYGSKLPNSTLKPLSLFSNENKLEIKNPRDQIQTPKL